MNPYLIRKGYLKWDYPRICIKFLEIAKTNVFSLFSMSLIRIVRIPTKNLNLPHFPVEKSL